VVPLPYQERRFVLLLPPFGVNTAAVYRAWDELASAGRVEGRVGGDGSQANDGARTNDLEAAALEVEPRLAAWRDRFAQVSGARPVLAGSGSTWFLEGTPSELGTAGRTSLKLGEAEGTLVAVRTVRADYGPPGPADDAR
jgi:4-diphosphocytidyl-2C-methyl-D-erythritol kinase